MRCPCGSGDAYAACCGPLHDGGRRAGSAEALMRSRYSAYALGDEAYVLATWHPSTRPADLHPDPALRWTGLEVVSSQGGPFDATGRVRFRASWRRGGQAGVLEEDSRFVREGGAWSYVGPARG